MNRSFGLCLAASVGVAALLAACSSEPQGGPITGTPHYGNGGTTGGATTSPGNQGTSGSGTGTGTGTGAGSGTATGSGTGTGTGTGTGSGSGTGTSTPVQPAPDAGPGSVTSAAHQFFNSTVYPELSVCQGCHSTAADGAPKMMDSPADTTYSELDSLGLIQSSSALLTKGSHDGGKAPALTSQQKTDITTWLGMEAQERQGQAAPTNVLAAVAACADQTKWNAIPWSKLVTQPRTNENPNKCTGCAGAICASCHDGGEYGFFMAEGSKIEPPGTTFQQSFVGAQSSNYVIKYFGLNGAAPVASNAILTKMNAVATGPAYSHPMFVMSQAMQTALDAFVTDAITNYTNHTCSTTGTAPADAGTD